MREESYYRCTWRIKKKLVTTMRQQQTTRLMIISVAYGKMKFILILLCFVSFFASDLFCLLQIFLDPTSR